MSEHVAKFVCGSRVRVTVDGLKGEGHIRSVHCRFWRSPDLRRYLYDVRFDRDKKILSCDVLQVEEEAIEELPE